MISSLNSKNGTYFSSKTQLISSTMTKKKKPHSKTIKIKDFWETTISFIALRINLNKGQYTKSRCYFVMAENNFQEELLPFFLVPLFSSNQNIIIMSLKSFVLVKLCSSFLVLNTKSMIITFPPSALLGIASQHLFRIFTQSSSLQLCRTHCKSTVNSPSPS